MAERAEASGGRMVVDTQLGGGTRIMAALPPECRPHRRNVTVLELPIMKTKGPLRGPKAIARLLVTGS